MTLLLQATVDNVPYASQNGSSPDPGLFQVPLFQANNLTQGQHTVVLEYTGSTGLYLDLDFVSDPLFAGA